MRDLLEKIEGLSESANWKYKWEGATKSDLEDADDLMDEVERAIYRLLDFVYRKVGDGKQADARDALPFNMYSELSRWSNVIGSFRGDLAKLKKEGNR